MYKNISGISIPSSWKYYLTEHPQGTVRRYGKTYRATPKEVFNTSKVDELRNQFSALSNMLKFETKDEARKLLLEKLEEVKEKYEKTLSEVRKGQEAEIKRMISNKK